MGRVQIFSLINATHAPSGDGSITEQDSGSGVVQQLPEDAGKRQDASPGDSSTAQPPDAGDVAADAGPQPCPSGTFAGTYQCDYEGSNVVVTGDMEFTIGPENVSTGIANIISGSVYSFLPRTLDDLTPVAQFPTVDLQGSVMCASPAQLVAKTGAVAITDASGLVTRLLSPAPVTAEVKGPYDAANGGYFSGSFTVYGPPNCIGTFHVMPKLP